MIRILCAAVLATACAASPASPASAIAPASARAADKCVRITEPPPESAPPTSVNTLRQAYYCILDNYFGGPDIKPATLLKNAFSAYTRNLMRRDADRADLQLPALTGDRDGDITAVTTALGTADPAALRAAIKGMVDGLHDNHARWMLPPTDSGEPMGTGIAGASVFQGPQIDPVARPPMFITRVIPDSIADKADVRPGDIVVKINGMPPFFGENVNPGIIDAVEAGALRLTLKRPTTGRIRTINLKEGPITAPPPQVTAKTLSGGVRYVHVPGFYKGAADEVIAKLQGKPKAVILDLRGNGGGSPQEVTRLLGAFAHGKITSYFCPATGECTANRTDDSVPLLRLPLVVLTDRGCASACEDFSAAVHGNDLGTLVGTRTAGAISGPAGPYLLDDGSVIVLPYVRHLGPAKEIVDTIGVPVDHYVPRTALDLASGRDPGVAKALALLKRP